MIKIISFQIHYYKIGSESVTASGKFKIMTFFLFYQNYCQSQRKDKIFMYNFYIIRCCCLISSGLTPISYEFTSNIHDINKTVGKEIV